MRRLLLSACAFCTFGLFAAFGTANAGSLSVLPGTSYAVPVEQAGNLGRPDLGTAVLGYGDRVDGDLSYNDGPESFLYEPQTAGADETRELQRMFPSSAWPPSMRY
jgi:hypothetical protein